MERLAVYFTAVTLVLWSLQGNAEDRGQLLRQGGKVKGFIIHQFNFGAVIHYGVEVDSDLCGGVLQERGNLIKTKSVMGG